MGVRGTHSLGQRLSFSKILFEYDLLSKYMAPDAFYRVSLFLLFLYQIICVIEKITRIYLPTTFFNVCTNWNSWCFRTISCAPIIFSWCMAVLKNAYDTLINPDQLLTISLPSLKPELVLFVVFLLLNLMV